MISFLFLGSTKIPKMHCFYLTGPGCQNQWGRWGEILSIIKTQGLYSLENAEFELLCFQGWEYTGIWIYSLKNASFSTRSDVSTQHSCKPKSFNIWNWTIRLLASWARRGARLTDNGAVTLMTPGHLVWEWAASSELWYVCTLNYCTCSAATRTGGFCYHCSR